MEGTDEEAWSWSIQRASKIGGCKAKWRRWCSWWGLIINLNLLPSVDFDEICQFKSDNLSNVIFRWTGVRQLRTASFVEKNLHLWMLRLRTQRQELKVEMEMICFRFAQVSQFCRSNASIARIRFRPKEGGLRISPTVWRNLPQLPTLTAFSAGLLSWTTRLDLSTSMSVKVRLRPDFYYLMQCMTFMRDKDRNTPLQ